MRKGILGALAGLAAFAAVPASAGYFPSIYESRYDYGSSYMDTYVDGVGAGVVVHERSYVGLNNPDPSTVQDCARRMPLRSPARLRPDGADHR